MNEMRKMITLSIKLMKSTDIIENNHNSTYKMLFCTIIQHLTEINMKLTNNYVEHMQFILWLSQVQGRWHIYTIRRVVKGQKKQKRLTSIWTDSMIKY